MVGWWLAFVSMAQDYASEAKERMDLEFDVDDLEEVLAVEVTNQPTAVPRAPLPLAPNSELQDITVFLDHARVTRTQRLTLAAGRHTVRFEGLPLALRPEGIDARIIDGFGRVASVELLSGQGDVESTGAITQVRDDAKELARKLGQVQDRIEALLAKRAYLRRAVLPNQASQSPVVRELRDMMDYVGSAERTLAEELRTQEQLAEELGDALRPLLTRLADPLATGRTVKVGVEVDDPKPITVALRYAVSGASWRPAYDARLLGGEVVLEQFGVVRQSTGEAWTDARLELSTAAVSPAGERPPLTPWVLGGPGVATQVEVGAGVFTEVGIDATAASQGLIASDLQAEVRGNGALVFAIEGRRTIKGDDSAQRVPIARQRLSAKASFSTVPRQALEVHRLITVGYDGGFPLLPGPVTTFVRGDYVGRGIIPSVVPGEALTLSFGPHDGFRVRRQLVTRKREKAGGSKFRYTLGFRISVVNHTDSTATIEVRDQIPVSREGRISVKVLELSNGTLDETSGQIRWTPRVEPGADQTMDLAFQIVAPADMARDLDAEIMMLH
ncbi:MAG: mucoidy inhibitor MuiA family protein [Myxococcota bacterium]